MEALSKYQKHALIRRIEFVEQELKELKNYQNIDLSFYQKDRRLQKEVERTVEIIANACIDIGKIILSAEKAIMPESYVEVFIKLVEINFLDENFAKELIFLAKVRNILAHHYIDIRFDLIETAINSIDKIEKFIQLVKTKVFSLN